MNEKTLSQLQQLAKPFPPALIKEAPQGKFGDYVPHSAVTERLLSIVGPYNFHVEDLIRGEAPMVIGKDHTADNPKYPARSDAVLGVTASLTVFIDGNPYTVTEIGTVDDPAMNHDAANAKNAASDAIKRCAMRLGLGLHLWSQEMYFLDKQLAQLAVEDGGLSTEQT